MCRRSGQGRVRPNFAPTIKNLIRVSRYLTGQFRQTPTEVQQTPPGFLDKLRRSPGKLPPSFGKLRPSLSKNSARVLAVMLAMFGKMAGMVGRLGDILLRGRYILRAKSWGRGQDPAGDRKKRGTPECAPPLFSGSASLQPGLYPSGGRSAEGSASSLTAVVSSVKLPVSLTGPVVGSRPAALSRIVRCGSST